MTENIYSQEELLEQMTLERDELKLRVDFLEKQNHTFLAGFAAADELVYSQRLTIKELERESEHLKALARKFFEAAGVYYNPPAGGSNQVFMEFSRIVRGDKPSGETGGSGGSE